MTRYLSQLLLRVFVFPQCPFHTRAQPWDFALFAFTTFTERDPKNVGVFLENVQRFSFFLRRFLKNVGRFYELLPTFLKVAAVCRQTGCLESHFFLFLCRKKCLFSALVCEGCESKKVQIPGNAPACHVRARKITFFEQNMTLIMSVSSRRNSPDFYIPFSRILAPKWEDSLQLNEEDGIPIKIL